MGFYKSFITFLFIFCNCLSSFAQAEKTFVDLVIGTYSRGNSEGIYTTTLDLSSGKLTPAQLVFKSKDPTYLASSNKSIIYAALREEQGQLAALRINQDHFEVVSHGSMQGNDPCYLSLSPNEQYIASANYNGGNVSIFKLSATGEIENAAVVISLSGKSVHPARQKSSHPHWVQWSPYDENTLYVIDLGSDKVMKYKFNYATGEVNSAEEAFNSLPGSGPRHLVFHPNKKAAYIVNELSNTLDFVKIEESGRFSLIEQKSTLPSSYQLPNQGAHIAINSIGDTLYMSNRGLNSIAIVKLNKSGEMTLQENIDTGGIWPRFFKLFEQYGYLLVANKKSNNIVVFKVNDDGSLIKTKHQIKIDQPTFIDEY